ncbi:hypothetical protein PCANC_05286 [Puccinia coronata f. sp. avenae]|uniref:Secreted protein n=1 Tax=Puccinia coronata f. sp. avenae TaxID=200324 RepID=A0A2N5VYP3_9BASI|nr:hypothetical protein PCANC_05286 [Puccinia coronata f. sp. avenae]
MSFWTTALLGAATRGSIQASATSAFAPLSVLWLSSSGLSSLTGHAPAPSSSGRTSRSFYPTTT